MLTVKQVGALLGISTIRIRHAERVGALPAPERVANAKVYDGAGVERIKTYFDGRKMWTKTKKKEKTK